MTMRFCISCAKLLPEIFQSPILTHFYNLHINQLIPNQFSLFFSDILLVHHHSVRAVIGYDHLRPVFELILRGDSSKSDVCLGMYLECTAFRSPDAD